MPMTYNEPTVPTYPASVVLPTAGDGVRSTSGAAPADPIWLKLQNGVAGARFQGFGGGIRRSIKCYASNAITVNPLGGVAVKVAGIWTALLDTTGTVFDPTNGGAVTLGISTRYWLYVTITAGALVYSISTTAPDAGLKYQDGDESKLYVSTFITNPDRSVVPYSQSDNRYDYYTPINQPSTRVLNNGAATLTTVVTISLALPAQAQNASLRFAMGTLATGHSATISYFDGNAMTTLVDNTLISAFEDVNACLDGANKFLYRVSDASYTVSGWVTGFNL